MKCWVVSPNLGAPGDKDLDAWCEFIRRRRVAVMGWGDDNRIGRAFRDDIQTGDLILVASGSNQYKRLCIAGIVSSEARDDLEEDTPTYYSFFRTLEPSIELPDDPSQCGLSFIGAAHGDAQRIPAMYQLYPRRNEIDKSIVTHLKSLLKLNETTMDTPEDEEPDEIETLVSEFKKSYLETSDGEYHRKLILKSREQGKINYQKALNLKVQGNDITDAVLYGILPHADTQNNRQNNHWVHIAPCVTKDIKEWFEGAGWVKNSDWPDIAQKLFNFIQHAISNPMEFESLCSKFDSTFPYKGFQVGMLSPILNALDSKHFFVVNVKPILVINWLTGTHYQAQIKDLPAIISTIKVWVDENRKLFDDIIPDGLTVYDTFDIFCHWLKTIKKYQKLDNRFERYGRGSAESARKIFEKIFPDISVRKSAEEFLTECITRAHDKNSNSWEITLGPRYIMLNVGFVKVLRLHFNETRIYLLGSAFSPELREKYADIIQFSDDLFKSLNEEVGICSISPSKFADIINDLKYAVFQFIEVNAVRAKSSIWASSHSPGVLKYLRSDLAREIPSPDYEVDIINSDDSGEYEDNGFTNCPDDFTVAHVAEVQPIYQPEFSIEECSKVTGYDTFTIQKWLRALERKKQAVFFGPPGTGKSFVSEYIARYIVGSGDGFWDRIQFHPAWGYEDFVQGLRPETDKSGNLRFKMKDGRFLEFCKKASLCNDKCVLIIDELNRANISRVFGELMFLLEYRKNDIPLAGGVRFSIPDNVIIIGTMNTADRSIALVDFALRRRFAFIELQPEYEILKKYQYSNDIDISNLITLLKDVNERINDKNFHLGISFFMVDNLKAKLEEIWKMEIETYLEEYFFNQPEAVAVFRWDKVKERLAF